MGEDAHKVNSQEEDVQQKVCRKKSCIKMESGYRPRSILATP